MADLCSWRSTCRGCNSSNLEKVVPLRALPVATPNFQVSAPPDDPVYREGVPLDLYLCRDCGLLQILAVINPNIQYRDYIYTTSLSLGLADHFRSYADAIVERLNLPPNAFVAEIGSNDGTLLRYFEARGCRILGIDPARAIAQRATANGIPTLATFFGQDVARDVKGGHGLADLIVANNVIANLDDLDDLFAGVRLLLAPSGTFVFETQYGADVVLRILLDTVYHEHLSYFCAKPLAALCRRHELKIVDIERIPTKGGSIRILACHDAGHARPLARVAEMIAGEAAMGLYGHEPYAVMVKKIAGIRDRVHKLVDAQDAPVGGYGVSVGTTTLLAQFELETRISFLIDDDPKKLSVFRGPGYDIPVVPPGGLANSPSKLMVVFAWRYADNIRSNQQAYVARGGKFVVPLPEVRLI